MPRTGQTWYKPSEFAKLAGITVRTLHHYDKLGILKPSDFTDAGYRLYRDRDFATLQQIATLKFIGLSLTQIGAFLESQDFDLEQALSDQDRLGRVEKSLEMKCET